MYEGRMGRGRRRQSLQRKGLGLGSSRKKCDGQLREKGERTVLEGWRGAQKLDPRYEDIYWGRKKVPRDERRPTTQIIPSKLKGGNRPASNKERLSKGTQSIADAECERDHRTGIRRGLHSLKRRWAQKEEPRGGGYSPGLQARGKL